MPRGVVIPADEKEPLRVEQFNSLEDYQRGVGGNIEAVDTEAPAATLFVNEEGKLRGLPFNLRAWLLYWGATPGLHDLPTLDGDVVVIGLPDEEGETTDLSHEVMDLLFPNRPFRIEVETIEAPGVWAGNQARYETCFQAWAAAYSLSRRWVLVTDTRVVAA